MRWIIFKSGAPFTLVKSILQLCAHWLVALINRFCGLYPSPLSPACKYMQMQEEWVEPKAWWASAWTRLTSLLIFPIAVQGAESGEDQGPESQQTWVLIPAAPLTALCHPGQVSSSWGREGPPLHSWENTLSCVGSGPKEAGTPEAEASVSTRQRILGRE